MNALNSAWTPERRAELTATLKTKVSELEQDKELRDIADWMIEACGLAPSHEHYQLVVLASILVSCTP